MSAIGSIGSSNSQYISTMLSRLDTNNDAKISKDEFVTGRPGDSSSSSASSLFDAMDTSGTGSMSVSDLASAFQNMSDLMQSTLISLQEQSGHGPGSGGQPPELPDANKMFGKLDTNGDGSLTKEEFLAGKPQGVSDEQAGKFWDKIAGSDTESLSQDAFTTSMKNAGPPPPPPPSGGSQAQGSTDTSSTDDSEESQIQKLISELLTAMQSYQSSTDLNKTTATDSLLKSLFA